VKRTADTARDSGASVARDRRLVDRDDHELLRFTIGWLPYGQVPEDELLVRFGLTRRRFTERIREIAYRNRDLIPPHTISRLLDLCEQIDTASEPAWGR
jgi:hypothetical protein